MTSLQPQVVPAPPVRLGGLSPEVMLFAALLVLPALWHSVIDGDLPLVVVLERYLFIVVGCAIVATLLQRYSESAEAISQRIGRLDGDAPKAPAQRPAVPKGADHYALDEPGTGPAPDLEPLPDLGPLDDLDSLDLLSEEGAEDPPTTFSLFDE